MCVMMVFMIIINDDDDCMARILKWDHSTTKNDGQWGGGIGEARWQKRLQKCFFLLLLIFLDVRYVKTQALVDCLSRLSIDSIFGFCSIYDESVGESFFDGICNQCKPNSTRVLRNSPELLPTITIDVRGRRRRLIDQIKKI